MLSKKVYHLNLRELETYVRDNCFINDEEEFTTMVDFYHDLGMIGHLIQYIAFNKIQSSAKPRIPRLFEFIKNNGIIYGVNCF